MGTHCFRLRALNLVGLVEMKVHRAPAPGSGRRSPQQNRTPRRVATVRIEGRIANSRTSNLAPETELRLRTSFRSVTSGGCGVCLLRGRVHLATTHSPREGSDPDLGLEDFQRPGLPSESVTHCRSNRRRMVAGPGAVTFKAGGRWKRSRKERLVGRSHEWHSLVKLSASAALASA